MTREEWARVEAAFAAVVELPAHERARALAEACGADRALRVEVESLLDAHDAAPAFLAAPPAWLSGDPPGDGVEPVPDRIGVYRIIRVLGRGGMGRVYLAEREAAGFRQQVALKVMRRGLDTDDLIARFRTERQILARLVHPNIARLYDVGATADGVPYFVMEHVDGEPILDYCARRQLTLVQRLRLFQTVCSAVQYAHRSLVVHRDIKPGNILVTSDGVPKLLDFGIAKILDDDGAQLTRADARIFTPEHSAPEQILGDAITTASDVYLLGVLLYELVSGTHPHAAAGTSRETMVRAVLERDPPPPSRRLAPSHASFRQHVEGDVDTITLKAIRREPEERYASVLSLSEDIDRCLDGLPVLARPATVRYRARKFVARNFAAVGAVAALFLILTAASGITLYQSGRIRAEATRVTRERDKALEVRTFLLEMFGSTGPDQPTGDTVTARELLDRRAATLRAAYAKDPEVLAEMMNALAEGYEKLGLFERAEPLAREALETRRALLVAEHPDIATSLNLLGWVLRERGQLDEAEPLLREAVDMGRRVFPPAGDARLARALNDLGVVREARGDYDEAAALYAASLDMRRRLLGEEHVGVAVTTSNLSVVLYRKGDIDGAVSMGEEALTLLQRILGPDHQRTTIVRSNLAAMQSAQGDHAGAARQHREIVDQRTRLLGARHPSVAYSMTQLANELIAAEQAQDAETLLRQALAIQTETAVPPERVAHTLRVYGDLKARTGRHAEALADYDEALRLTRSALGPMHAEVAQLHARVGALHESLGERTAAARAYREALRIAEAALGADHPRTIRIRTSLEAL